MVAGAGLLGVLYVAAAVGRVRAGETLSPPDLAFFFQSCWSAAHGAGFHQTALEFDRGTLLGSIHLSPVRALQVPICRLVTQPAGIVATQAAAVAAGAVVCTRLLPPRQTMAAAALLLLGLHPLTMALATVDMRPITFLVPAGALVALGLHRERAVLVAAGAALAAAAREEAPLVLAAFLPFAWGRRRRVQLALLAGIGLSAALPWLAWGHGANIRTNTDPLATLDQIRTGARPVFRWHQETGFLGRALVAGTPALLAPELLLPALGGWLWILVFSELEPAAPGQGGLHYLAVVGALFLPAIAVGLGRLLRWRASPALLVGLTVLLVVGGGPELAQLLRWVAAPGNDENNAFIDVLNATPCPVPRTGPPAPRSRCGRASGAPHPRTPCCHGRARGAGCRGGRARRDPDGVPRRVHRRCGVGTLEGGTGREGAASRAVRRDLDPVEPQLAWAWLPADASRRSRSRFMTQMEMRCCCCSRPGVVSASNSMPAAEPSP